MHAEVERFLTDCKARFPAFFASPSRVLDVGSFDVNGSPRRWFDAGCAYLGVDCRPGPGVNLVADARQLPFQTGFFDCVVSTEALEHAKDWRAVLREMLRLARTGGLVAMTAACPPRPAHGMEEFGQDGGHYENVDPEVVRTFSKGLMIFEVDSVNGDVRAAWVKE